MKPTSSHSRAGIAIIIILLILVLLTAVTVAFLSRTSMEIRSSAVDRASVQGLALADMAVGVVQSQINAATRQSGVSWASQPGVIRTFDTGGNLVAAHKLYSALTLSATSIATLRSDDTPPADWADEPALWTNLNAPVEADGIRRYPILDPGVANDPTQAEGFTISDDHPGEAAMPVRWLYVLEDGRLVSPQTSGTSLLIPGSETSPIVGRIAFWTDDETCKVNLNTAGDGTYWDAPHAFSIQEGELANSQPFINEFQRYPGHPATTSLRAAFPFLTGEQILQEITPRYRWGGSEGGTVPTSSQNAILDLRGTTTRLYSSVDELVFAPDRSESSLARDAVEQRRFLLTAQSRAPELNLFNLPRMAIWPIHATDDAAHRTEIDREIARCATINGEPYYFQRTSASSPTADFGITRNQTLYSYLESLMGRPIPGFGGGTFAAKYPGNESRQILMEIFDVIRCANLFDTVLEASGGQPFTPGRSASDLRVALPGHGQAAPLRHPTNGTMGFGRFYTISEASLHLICTADEAVPESNDPETNRTLDEATPLATDERRLQAAFLFELFSPAAGWSILHPSMEVEISGLENIEVNGTAVFPASANGSTQINASQRPLVGGRAWGSNPGVRYPLFLKYAPARGRIPADPVPTDSYASWAHLYPFISDPFTVDKTAPMAISLSGPVRMQLYAVDPASPGTRTLVQAIEIPAHPPRDTRIPALAASDRWWTFSRAPALDGGSAGRLDGISRVQSGSTSPGQTNARWFEPSDVVVSWIPSHGDYRLLAASHEVAAADSPFAPHPSWTASQSFATTLYDNLPTYLLSGLYTGAKYRSDIGYAAAAMPDRPPGGSEVTTGDWDRGFADMLDGPYINKPDEGTIVRAASPSWFGDYPYFIELASSTRDIGAFFSPTRQMPSPGVFGSLPTGVARGLPWQTLLFRPQPSHPGAASPKDHLMLDLFWMPVAEPYAISEPFSTAGKVNLNYEILPFSTVTRATGLYALLKGEKIAAIPTVDGARYAARTPGSPNPADYRLEIDVEETLRQFAARFADDDVFRSASEICDLWIVPKGSSLEAMSTFWDDHLLTGENLRERIYTTLYPRVTTQSNTFTVHLKVQTLKAGPRVPKGEWVEEKGQITGEYQGSVLIERYLDPNGSGIPDYAADPSASPSLPDLYRWRTLSQLRFAP